MILRLILGLCCMTLALCGGYRIGGAPGFFMVIGLIGLMTALVNESEARWKREK